MGPRSAPYDCPIWAPFKPHMAPFTIQPHVALFKPHAALFKWQPVVGEKQGRYQNDQHDEPSHMGSRSAPYDCPVWALFEPCLSPVQPHSPFSPVWPCSNPVQPHSPFSPMQEPHSEEMISECSIARYTKMFSSTNRENCSNPDHVNTADSPALQ